MALISNAKIGTPVRYSMTTDSPKTTQICCKMQSSGQAHAPTGNFPSEKSMAVCSSGGLHVCLNFNCCPCPFTTHCFHKRNLIFGLKNLAASYIDEKLGSCTSGAHAQEYNMGRCEQSVSILCQLIHIKRKKKKKKVFFYKKAPCIIRKAQKCPSCLFLQKDTESDGASVFMDK